MVCRPYQRVWLFSRNIKPTDAVSLVTGGNQPREKGIWFSILLRPAIQLSDSTAHGLGDRRIAKRHSH